MEKELILLESISEVFLDIATIRELLNKNIEPTDFEWKFNFENVNIIPVLELYRKGKVCKSIESTEFSETFQELLRETQILFRDTNEYESKFDNECSNCDLKDICPLKKGEV